MRRPTGDTASAPVEESGDETVSFVDSTAARVLASPTRGERPRGGPRPGQREGDRGSRERGLLWAVVLAGGEVRKDDASLRRALRRAFAVVPRARTLVVVAERHRRFLRDPLADLPGENLIFEPRDRGTATGILLPVLDIVLHRDREARVLVLPADHDVGAEAVLRRALLAAAKAVRRPGAPLVLLGMVGQDDDREYTWILPSARPSDGLRSVLSFVAKADGDTSREWAGLGALVSSSIFASRGRTLVRLYEDALPQLLRRLVPAALARRPEGRLRELYDEIPSHDFSRAVLERCAGSLAVLAVPPCGWSHLGAPSRVRANGDSGHDTRAALGEAH